MESANCDTEQQKKTETSHDEDIIAQSNQETESAVVFSSSSVNGSYEKNRSRSASPSKATDFSQNVEGHINQTAAVNIAGGTSDDDESDGEIGETTNLLEKSGMNHHQKQLNSIISCSWCERNGSCAPRVH